jgi:tetratricopeptide (TPR) repeat protein
MVSFLPAIWLGLVFSAISPAQNSGNLEFATAYQCVAQKNYDSAIEHFRAGLAKEPARTNARKDLAYTLLKAGDSAAARDEFEAALRCDAKDEQAALEFAFLAYETGKPSEARRTFDQLRKTGSAPGRQTAEQAYQNIERAMAEGVCCRAETELPELPMAGPELPGSGGWPRIFDAVGIAFPSPSIRVVDSAANVPESGITIVQGNGPASERLGIHADGTTVLVRQISDVHNPAMQIKWRQPVMVPRTQLPPEYQIFAREKSSDTPVLAGKRTPHGAILWIATSPGEKGFERYPYLIQSLVDLGLPLPMRSTNLWAFFDSAYRIRADVDYLAKHWRESGISALHVAGWHNMEPDPTNDEYLAKLIEACHRNAILVYLWLELPHVSEKFWADHPEWREKTALKQDARIDWRKPMNLQNPACSRAAAKLVDNLAQRFDWDGVNLAELSFETSEGATDPSRVTPMNDNVRNEFQEIAGFDAALLFDKSSAHANEKDIRTFLDFRAALARRLRAEWLNNIERIRKSKPYLDVVLTGREGSIEAADSSRKDSLGLDLKVMDRFPNVYPSARPTGVELLEQVHEATRSASVIAVYSESSIEPVDLPLIGAAAARARVTREEPDGREFDSPEQIRFLWKGPVEVDGKLWPVRNGDLVLAPAGHHRITATAVEPPLAIADFNGRIQSATVLKSEVDLSYESRTRALVSFDRDVASIDLDGAPFWKAGENSDSLAAILPAGQHLLAFTRR